MKKPGHATELIKSMNNASDRIAKLEAERQEVIDALVHAKQFIANGIEFGYIQKPNPHFPEGGVLAKIKTALRNAGMEDL